MVKYMIKVRTNSLFMHSIYTYEDNNTKMKILKNKQNLFFS